MRMTFSQLADKPYSLAVFVTRSTLTGIAAAMALMVTDVSAQQAALPPELATLNEQFIKLQRERITVPFEADLAILNTGYFSAIDKAMAAEKEAANLDGILALETEKKLVIEKQVFAEKLPLPETDDEKTPAAVKNLRAIYRMSYAKLEAQRLKSQQGLVAPLDVRLKQMEGAFIKADRIADAKTVRGYREALAEEVPPAEEQKPNTTLNPAGMLAAKDGFTNTLGMKFLPVKGTAVLFCVHETRRGDYAAYAAAVPGVDGTWKDVKKNGIPVGDKDDHPVVSVNWEDAQAFCAWLSKKEGKTYRLPTDLEWSIAVGIGREERLIKRATPEMLSGKVANQFPWGGDFPPKTKDQAGNYADMAWKEKFPTEPFIEGYNDGFPTTAPVMSFKANKLGLYDLGGNVFEWCEDWYNAAQTDRVVRGASWIYYHPGPIQSSFRGPSAPDFRTDHNGFRCVMVPGGSPKSD